jgi:hypothetical protein
MTWIDVALLTGNRNHQTLRARVDPRIFPPIIIVTTPTSAIARPPACLLKRLNPLFTVPFF